MKYFLVSNIYDEEGAYVALADKKEIEAEEVIDALRRNLHVDAPPLEEAPAPKKKAEKKKAEKKEKTGGRKKTSCGLCGETGHTKPTCPGTKGHPEAPVPASSDSNSERSEKIRADLKEGEEPELIAERYRTSVSVVKFIRNQMRAAGEL